MTSRSFRPRLNLGGELISEITEDREATLSIQKPQQTTLLTSCSDDGRHKTRKPLPEASQSEPFPRMVHQRQNEGRAAMKFLKKAGVQKLKTQSLKIFFDDNEFLWQIFVFRLNGRLLSIVG